MMPAACSVLRGPEEVTEVNRMLARARVDPLATAVRCHKQAAGGEDELPRSRCCAQSGGTHCAPLGAAAPTLGGPDVA
jgi:hypothetical protein